MLLFGINVMLRMPVSKITSRSPDHPAASFFYPGLSSLPTIAVYTLSLVKQFNSGRKLDQAQTDCFVNPTDDLLEEKGKEEKNDSNSKGKETDLVTISTFDVTISNALGGNEKMFNGTVSPQRGRAKFVIKLKLLS